MIVQIVKIYSARKGRIHKPYSHRPIYTHIDNHLKRLHRGHLRLERIAHHQETPLTPCDGRDILVPVRRCRPLVLLYRREPQGRAPPVVVPMVGGGERGGAVACTSLLPVAEDLVDGATGPERPAGPAHCRRWWPGGHVPVLEFCSISVVVVFVGRVHYDLDVVFLAPWG